MSTSPNLVTQIFFNSAKCQGGKNLKLKLLFLVKLNIFHINWKIIFSCESLFMFLADLPTAVLFLLVINSLYSKDNIPQFFKGSMLKKKSMLNIFSTYTFILLCRNFNYYIVKSIFSPYGLIFTD